jgi:hypothetical protein
MQELLNGFPDPTLMAKSAQEEGGELTRGRFETPIFVTTQVVSTVASAFSPCAYVS